MDVIVGFEESSRGKLIMACGVGKTFTSLRIAQSVVGAGGSVLFLVPSIALMYQTPKNWSAERSLPMRAFAICSDSKVGKFFEDYSVSDLAYSATTNTEQLLVGASVDHLVTAKGWDVRGRTASVPSAGPECTNSRPFAEPAIQRTAPATLRERADTPRSEMGDTFRSRTALRTGSVSFSLGVGNGRIDSPPRPKCEPTD